MSQSSGTVAVVVPSYKRPQLLRLLIRDLTRQSQQPDLLIVVDGDPESGEVVSVLHEACFPLTWSVMYVPSPYGNNSFQRYLCWRAAQDHSVVVYLDDDLRLPDKDFLEKLVRPFAWDHRKVAGVTAPIRFPANHERDNASVENRGGHLTCRLNTLGNARRTPPGHVTPMGDRVLPQESEGDYSVIHWLRGGVMAFSSESLSSRCFPDDLFALSHIGCGLGEDTFISRCAGLAGELLLATCTSVEHPSSDISRAYPHKGYGLGYARAYSRRFQNDRYRLFAAPHFSDRVALIKSYAGNTLLNWWRAFTSFKAYRFAYAWGYTLGALRGLVQKPTAQNLTPDIDWWADAEAALADVQIVQPGVGAS